MKVFEILEPVIDEFQWRKEDVSGAPADAAFRSQMLLRDDDDVEVTSRRCHVGPLFSTVIR